MINERYLPKAKAKGLLLMIIGLADTKIKTNKNATNARTGLFPDKPNIIKTISDKVIPIVPTDDAKKNTETKDTPLRISTIKFLLL